MCKTFEEISGKKCKGDIGLLDGLTKMYRDARYSVVVIPIPVEIMEIDHRYQTEERTDRSLNYLVNNWDESLLAPVIGVPHWETGKVFLVDGFGRLIASQIVNKDKYKDLLCMLLLDAPKDPEERLKYEADKFAKQNKYVANLTAVQKHGSMIILNDAATKNLEKLREKYGFEYSARQGNREASILGSYTEALSICKIDNGACAEFVFDICKGAGFDRKQNGYSTYIMRSLRDIYKLYTDNRKETKKLLIKELRGLEPITVKARAVVNYPMLEMKTAISLYLEDLVVNKLGLEQSREVLGAKVMPIKKVSSL